MQVSKAASPSLVSYELRLATTRAKNRFDNAAGMLADLRLDQLREMRSQAVVRAFLVRPHDKYIIE